MQGRLITTKDVNGNTVEVYLPSRREVMSETAMRVLSAVSDLNAIRELLFESGELPLNERMALSAALDALNPATHAVGKLFTTMRDNDEAGR